MRWVKTQAYVLSGVCAAIAGIILAGRNSNVPADLGVGYEIQAISAAIIGGASLMGGRGRVLGAVLGALTLALAVNIINLAGVPSSFQKIVIGVILLLAVIANYLSDYARVATLRWKARRLSSGSAWAQQQTKKPGSLFRRWIKKEEKALITLTTQNTEMEKDNEKLTKN